MQNLRLNYVDGNIKVDLRWFDEFYYDFKCKTNSVLLTTQSRLEMKCYRKKEELKELLTRYGYEIFEADVEKDIRFNLHLVNQIRNILTVDTCIYWLGLALGKSPCAFFRHGENNERSFTEWMLGTKNLIPWYRSEEHTSELQSH